MKQAYFFQIFKKFTCFTSLIATCCAHSFAASVQSVEPNGTIVLESGEKVCFEGLKMSPEAAQFLPVLLAKKNVDFERGEIAAPACGYLYVNTSELTVPFKHGDSPDAKRYLVNELLLKTGAASVDTNAKFHRKEQFLKIEAEARNSGQGIWSYENYGVKSRKRAHEKNS